ncbi:MAG TPA: hypothetical protein VF132_08660, partial [Rudaea sp.]
VLPVIPAKALALLPDTEAKPSPPNPPLEGEGLTRNARTRGVAIFPKCAIPAVALHVFTNPRSQNRTASAAMFVRRPDRVLRLCSGRMPVKLNATFQGKKNMAAMPPPLPPVNPYAAPSARVEDVGEVTEF